MCLLINDVVLKKTLRRNLLTGSDKYVFSGELFLTNLRALTHYLREKRDTVKILVEAPAGCISDSSCVNDGSLKRQANVRSSVLKNKHKYITAEKY